MRLLFRYRRRRRRRSTLGFCWSVGSLIPVVAATLSPIIVERVHVWHGSSVQLVQGSLVTQDAYIVKRAGAQVEYSALSMMGHNRQHMLVSRLDLTATGNNIAWIMMTK